jgi:hypothetical protein
MLAIDNGSNSNYSTLGDASFPVFHAAALDRRGSMKGGPYSEGAFPGSGQFGLMTVTDADGGLTVDWVGLNYTGRELLRYQFRLPTTEVSP